LYIEHQDFNVTNLDQQNYDTVISSSYDTLDNDPEEDCNMPNYFYITGK